ncbi:MAG: DUF1015 family protein [Gammaproteobacteria bacterium]|nr:DUF1015 family protein [Gammaproteobacteria bacterium]
MPRISAFDSWLVKQQHASRTVAPSYDAVSAVERQKFAREHPENFLNTMRLMEDFQDDERPEHSELLRLNRRVLDRLLENDAFEYQPEPSLFLYQLDTGTHVQTGVVCEVPVDEYDSGNIRKHEKTLTDKESLLVNYLKVVGVSSSPICLTYSQSPSIDKLVDQICDKPATLDFQSFDDVEQRIWQIQDPNIQSQFVDLFSSAEVTYLTDGHHRAASASRYCQTMRAEFNGEAPASTQKLLVALFPDNQLRLLPFHRSVRDLNGKNIQQILDELEKDFTITRVEQNEFAASHHGEFGLFHQDVWYKLEFRHDISRFANPVNRLDATILQNYILEPIFGIRESRDDPRLDYVPDVGGIDTIRDKVTEGWPVILAMHAASIEQLMAVADANELMPPKSTYFDPKPRSGIFVRKRG